MSRPERFQLPYALPVVTATVKPLFYAAIREGGWARFHLQAVRRIHHNNPLLPETLHDMLVEQGVRDTPEHELALGAAGAAMLAVHEMLSYQARLDRGLPPVERPQRYLLPLLRPDTVSSLRADLREHGAETIAATAEQEFRAHNGILYDSAVHFIDSSGIVGFDRMVAGGIMLATHQLLSREAQAQAMNSTWDFRPGSSA